jgi:uncharacterized protein (DUF2062 family)
MHRVSRLPGSAYSIAAGFACGAAMSLTPFVGFHFALAALISWSIGGSILAAAVGTAVGNPWTFPFIWFWLYQFGNWLLGADSASLSQELTIGYIWDHPGRVLLPMTVGSIPTAAVGWMVAYWPLRRVIERYQASRSKRLARKVAEAEGREEKAEA